MAEWDRDPPQRVRTWYVLHVKPRTEKKVDDFIRAIGGAFHYLPLMKKVTKVQRRKVVRWLPVFPGYVFVRLHPDELYRVLNTKQVVHRIEVPQPRRMIHQLRQVVHAGRLPTEVQVVESFTAGEYVRVKSGPLRGIEGQVRRTGSATSIVLVVEILGRALEAAVSPVDLEKL